MARLSQEQIDFKIESDIMTLITLFEASEDTENLISNNGVALVLYCIFFLQIIEKSKFKEEFKKRNMEHIFDEIMEEMLKEEYIEELNVKNEISGGSLTYIVDKPVATDYLVDNFDVLARYIELEKDVIMSGMKKAINQHASIEHYIAINTLKKICEKENIKYFDAPEDLVLKLEKKEKKMRKAYTKSEFDLKLIYNQKKIYIEVERGTTTYYDMVSKMDKINMLLDEVVFVCPNQKSLDATRSKIERWEEEYEDRLGRGDIDKIRNLKILYVNLSAIRFKKGKKLGNKLKDFMRKDFYLR